LYGKCIFLRTADTAVDEVELILYVDSFHTSRFPLLTKFMFTLYPDTDRRSHG